MALENLFVFIIEIFLIKGFVISQSVSSLTLTLIL